jgi:hypothetical protein
VHSVIETPDFIMDAKKSGISDYQRQQIVTAFAKIPASGELIQGTGGARKTRFGGRGKGKSGGYRVISYYGGPDIPVFLLNVFGKGERANLSKSECNQIKIELAALAREYRQGVRRRVTRR